MNLKCICICKLIVKVFIKIIHKPINNQNLTLNLTIQVFNRHCVIVSNQQVFTIIILIIFSFRNNPFAFVYQIFYTNVT